MSQESVLTYVQAIARGQDVLHAVKDQLENIIHLNLDAIRTTSFLDISSKQPAQIEDFAAGQRKFMNKQMEAVSVR